MKLTTRVLLFFLCTGLLVKPIAAETPPAAVVAPPTNYFGVSIILGVAALYCTYCYFTSKAEQIQKDILDATKVALAAKKLRRMLMSKNLHSEILREPFPKM